MRQEHYHITVYITSAWWLFWIWLSEVFLACYKYEKRFCNVIYLLSLPAISVLFSGSCAYSHCVDTHSGKRNQLCLTHVQTPGEISNNEPSSSILHFPSSEDLRFIREINDIYPSCILALAYLSFENQITPLLTLNIPGSWPRYSCKIGRSVMFSSHCTGW